MRHALPALAALTLGCATAATAGDSVEVRYHDLDLSTERGLKTLERRINYAARDVCGARTPDTGTRIITQDAFDCVDKAKATASRQVAALIQEAAQKGG